MNTANDRAPPARPPGGRISSCWRCARAKGHISAGGIECSAPARKVKGLPYERRPQIAVSRGTTGSTVRNSPRGAGVRRRRDGVGKELSRRPGALNGRNKCRFLALTAAGCSTRIVVVNNADLAARASVSNQQLGLEGRDPPWAARPSSGGGHPPARLVNANQAAAAALNQTAKGALWLVGAAIPIDRDRGFSRRKGRDPSWGTAAKWRARSVMRRRTLSGRRATAIIAVHPARISPTGYAPWDSTRSPFACRFHHRMVVADAAPLPLGLLRLIPGCWRRSFWFLHINGRPEQWAFCPVINHLGASSYRP